MKPNEIEKIMVDNKFSATEKTVYYPKDIKDAIQAGYDFAIQSLADPPDEGMLLDSDEVSDYITNMRNGYVEVNIPLLLKAQLAKVQSIYRAKVEKQHNPYPPESKQYAGYFKAKSDTLKLLGGK